MENDRFTYRNALDDFKRARSKAALQRFWAGLMGKSLDLLPYDEISAKLHAVSRQDIGLQTVQVREIVGSVGRSEDFNRNFLPLRDSDMDRWARVKTAMTSPTSPGVPPVSLYKIGDAYFVLDGNHRVSVAKQMGIDTIEAYVTEVSTRVPVSSSITDADLVEKAAYVDFLNKTRVDQILPDVEFSLNLTQNYDLLEEHIRVHRYYMGIEQSREVTFEEATADWYDKVYAPVVEIIHTSGLDDEYRDLTMTDLYLWVLDHQSLLQTELGMPIRTAHAAEHLAMQDGKEVNPVSARGEQHIEETLLYSDEVAGTLSPRVEPEGVDCLFRDILVALSDDDEAWLALEQAILINQCPEGNIRGLHVIDAKDKKSSETHTEMQQRFKNRLADAGMSGKLLMAEGDISAMLLRHSLLSDILVMKLTYAPTGSLFDRLSSGISTLLHKSRRPVLFVKQSAVPIQSILLAYDGSPKSKEALYVAAYSAARFKLKLDVFSLDNGTADLEAEASFAKTYLRKLNLDFTYRVEQGDNFAEAVLEAAEVSDASVIVLGGYSGSSILDRVFGSAIDTLLEKTVIPVLVCQ